MKAKILYIVAVAMAVLFSPFILIGTLVYGIIKAIGNNEQDYGRLCD